MPAKRHSFDVDDWIALYESGMGYEQIANQVGVATMTVWKHLRQRGIGRTQSEGLHQSFLNRTDAIRADVMRRYDSGESVLALSKRYGITRDTVTLILRDAGVYKVRGAGEANRIRFLDPAQRGKVAIKAHLSMGKGESELYEMLIERGIVSDRQWPIGSYNVDMAYRDVAVEVHAPQGNPLRPRGRELKRCENLLGLGWNILYVWTAGRPIESAAADQVVSLIDSACRNPTIPRQYWVILSDGQLVASGSGKPHELSFKGSHARRRRYSS